MERRVDRGRALDAQVEDDRLDVDLAPRLIETPDHLAHRGEVVRARRHDERVVGLLGAHLHRRLEHLVRRWVALPAGSRVPAASSSPRAERLVDGPDDLLRVGVLEHHDVHLPLHGDGDVDGPHQLEQSLVSRRRADHEQRVGSVERDEPSSRAHRRPGDAPLPALSPLGPRSSSSSSSFFTSAEGTYCSGSSHTWSSACATSISSRTRSMRCTLAPVSVSRSTFPYAMTAPSCDASFESTPDVDLLGGDVRHAVNVGDVALLRRRVPRGRHGRLVDRVLRVDDLVEAPAGHHRQMVRGEDREKRLVGLGDGDLLRRHDGRLERLGRRGNEETLAGHLAHHAHQVASSAFWSDSVTISSGRRGACSMEPSIAVGPSCCCASELRRREDAGNRRRGGEGSASHALRISAGSPARRFPGAHALAPSMRTSAAEIRRSSARSEAQARVVKERRIRSCRPDPRRVWPRIPSRSRAPRRLARRANAPRLRQLASAKLPPTTSEQLVAVLLKVGGRVLAQHGHGLFIVIRRRLLFVPAAHWLPEAALADALRVANLTDERFAELRAAAH